MKQIERYRVILLLLDFVKLIFFRYFNPNFLVLFLFYYGEFLLILGFCGASRAHDRDHWKVEAG